jgi:hypothetical protein
MRRRQKAYRVETESIQTVMFQAQRPSWKPVDVVRKTITVVPIPAYPSQYPPVQYHFVSIHKPEKWLSMSSPHSDRQPTVLSVIF